MKPTHLLAFALLAVSPYYQAHADPVPLPTLSALPVPKTYDAAVSTDRNAQFKTLQDAIDAAPDNATQPYVIIIKPGRYRWQQTFIPKTKRFIHLVGEDPATTIISFHLNVFETLKDRRIERYEGNTLIALGDDFEASNLTIENTSGDHGQALALRIDGDRAVVRNCYLLGWQDTLMVNRGRQYFRDCYIEGRVDFIFGSGTSVFENCEIRSKNGGYVTAASTSDKQPFGYVFLRCKLTGDPEAWDKGSPVKKAPQAYLGRPWGEFASVAFIECEMGDFIKPEGWHNWGKPEREKTVRYSEYKSKGPGADTKARVSWARQLSDAEAKDYTVQNILGGSDGWNPLSR